jgi:hypothetical protein
MLCFSIRCATGSRWASTSGAASAVALNAPKIVLAPLACMLWSVSGIFTVYEVPLLLEFGQAEHAYIVYGTTTPL